MKKTILLMITLYNSMLYGQTFDGNLGSKSLNWAMDQKDFNSLPRVGITPMSIKLWDNYEGANAPSSWGSLLEINGRDGHLVSQLYFDNTWNGSRIQYRSAFYSQNAWESWRYLLDSKSNVESAGNLKIAGNGYSYVLGSLGIGTTDYTDKLHVEGGGVASSVSNNEGGYLSLLNQSKTGDQFNTWRIYNMTGGYGNSLQFWGYSPSGSNSGSKMTLLDNGNVGIGTTNPTHKLHVEGGGVASSVSNNEGGYLSLLNQSKTGDQFNTWRIYNMTGGYGNSLQFWGYSPSGSNSGSKMTLLDNGNVGIGTTNPTHKLHVEGGGVASSVSNNEGGYLSLLNQSKTGDQFNTWRIYNMTGGYGNSLQFWGYSPSGSNSGSKMTLLDNGNVGIGTTNPTSKLTVAGNINSREVKVTVDAGADFVFENNYNLPSLESVDKFIKENKHLPEIASAKEMQKDGINLSEMNIKLLQKIEELTLYVIEMKKENQEMKRKNQKQDQKIVLLESKLSSK